MSQFLGIDLGTQSLKAIVHDSERREVAAAGSSELHLISRADGTREQLAEWWIEALHQALRQIPPACLSSVKAIAVSGQQHGFVPLAADGRVLAPVKLWCDTATSRECDEIAARFGGRQRCIEEVGNAILPGYTASKIAWLKNRHPELYAELATILLPHDYLNHYLTGEFAMECGDASGAGMLDIRTRDWHAGMLAAVDPDRDLSACLPPLIGAGGVVVLPFYNGERTPNLPNGKGCILGLNDANMTPANIVRASMESAIFGLRAGLEAFARTHDTLVDRIREIRLTGGAARSAVWRQIVADNFGRPVRLPASREGAAMGAALNAMLLGSANHGNSQALAAAADEHVQFDEVSTATPNSETAAAYHRHYETYLEYLEQLTPMFE